jgi:hypothetical protein
MVVNVPAQSGQTMKGTFRMTVFAEAIVWNILGDEGERETD